MTILFSQVINCQIFSYDDLNRLIQTDYGNGYTISYEYDKLGNRTKRIVTAGCIDLASISYHQGFEYGLGEWKQIESDNENWTFEQGNTQTSSTGPSGASEKNNYLYTEPSLGRTNKVMMLQSGCFQLPNSGDFTFSMDYHMYGADVGRLSVYVSDDNFSSTTQLLTTTGDKGNQWNQLVYDLSSFIGESISFRIVGTTGDGIYSDIAIDNIRIGSACPDNLVISNTLSNSFSSLPGGEMKASNKITADAILLSGAFHFGAGECIDLNGGFEVRPGVLLLVDNDGCVTTSSSKDKK